MAPIVVIVLLMVLTGVFVMAEMAVVSSRKPRLQQFANEGSHGAQTALELATHPDRFLATTQIGITLVSILTGAFGERTLTERLSLRLEVVPQLAGYREPLPSPSSSSRSLMFPRRR
jgi:putative hemolysin